MLPLSIAGREPDPELARAADRRRGPRATAAPTARPSSRAASSSAWRWRGRWCRSPRWCSPTSPPATSTRTPRDEVLALLRQAVDDFGQTVVMVTHDAHAAAYADRLISSTTAGSSTTAAGTTTGAEPDARPRRCRGPRGPPAALGGRLTRSPCSSAWCWWRAPTCSPTRSTASFDDIFDAGARRASTSWSPRGRSVRQDDGGAAAVRRARARAACARCRAWTTAAGSVDALVRLVDDDNERPAATGSRRTSSSSVLPEPFEPVTYTEGRAPADAREAAIDKATADRERPRASATGSAWPATRRSARYRIVGIDRARRRARPAGRRRPRSRCPRPSA